MTKYAPYISIASIILALIAVFFKNFDILLLDFMIVVFFVAIMIDRDLLDGEN